MRFFSSKQNGLQLDELQYYIPRKAIADTERILLDFPFKRKPDEMIAYWAGIKKGNKSTVRLVVIPNAKTNSGRVIVSQEANFHFVRALSSRNLVQIAQVHTHPTSWVGHSLGDSKYAAFKVKGLLSIVVPSYCRKGMLSLEKCGVHRFDGKKFIRLPNKYLKDHLHILNGEESGLEDLRK